MEDFFDIFSDDDMNSVLNSPGNDTNDYNTKEIGDRVSVLDYSSVSHDNGNELEPDDYEKITDKDYYIVIATRQKNTKKRLNSVLEYKQDLIIVNPKTNEKFRIASKHIKLYLKTITNKIYIQ